MGDCDTVCVVTHFHLHCHGLIRPRNFSPCCNAEFSLCVCLNCCTLVHVTHGSRTGDAQLRCRYASFVTQLVTDLASRMNLSDCRSSSLCPYSNGLMGCLLPTHIYWRVTRCGCSALHLKSRWRAARAPRAGECKSRRAREHDDF